MEWARVVDFFDNPILVKHARSRMRRQPFVASLVVVQALCLCIVWAGYQLNIFISGGAFEFLALLQGIILVVMGGSQVSAAVNGARASGILDFHRVSPLSATELTFGFFFGAPIREYLLFASTFPYAAICLAVGAPTFRGLVQVMIVLLTSAWIIHGLALLNALISRPRANARGAVGFIVFFLFLFYFLINALRMNRLVPSAVLFDGDLRCDFYGHSLPWLIVVLFFEAPLLFFIYIAARRKMDSERLHPFTKLQALAALGLLSCLTLGIIWRQDGYEVLEVSVLYIMVVIAILLTVTVTPSLPEYFKGLWRARQRGQSHLPWWDDLAINRVYLFLACFLVLASANIAWSQSGSEQGFANSSRAGFPLAIAMGVLVVAYFGLALQFFSLRYGARGKIYFGLFLFFAWLLPLVAGTIVAMATAPMVSEAGSQALLSLSPVVGIATIAMPTGSASMVAATVRQAAAITPALLFAFLFNSLLIAARRRTHRAFQTLASQFAGRGTRDKLATAEEVPALAAPAAPAE
jgi:hypothetical protein